MENMAKVTINGETKEYPCGTSYRDIVNEYQKDTEARSYWSRWMGDFGSFIRGSRVTAR